MKIVLHDANKLKACNWETEKCPIVGTVEVDGYEFGDPLEVSGKFYSTHTATQNREHISVSEAFIEADPEDKDYENHITCPYCGHKDRDSWEADDEEESEECDCCGGIFSYQRIVTVEYSSQPVKPPNPKKGIWKGANPCLK